MRTQLAIQLALAFASLLVVSALVFWLVDLLPGDTATLILGQNATDAAVTALRDKLGQHGSVAQRYAIWLSETLRGNFGNSIVAGRPVMSIVGPRLANSLTLAAVALIIHIPLALGLAILTAVKRGTAVDTMVSTTVLFGMSIPEFIIAIFLMISLAIVFPLFPPLALIDTARGPLDMIYIVFLPAASLTVVMTAYAIRLLRESIIEILQSNHVRMATLKGLPRSRILLHHVLPGAVGPALAVTATNVAYLIGSVVLVETVFNFPGIGRQLIESLVYKDYPVVQAIILLLCSIYILSNFCADAIIFMLNPKLRDAK